MRVVSLFSVQSADTQNLKEKHEVDLKKEIKKLQRLRDQIKTWVGSSEVKDKDALIEARKLIETKMEQFKICEKETKTKTYSKEGLAREDKLDPAEENKLRTTAWIAEYVERFQEQVEEKDFDIEKLSSGKGKKTNKHQIEQLQLHIAHHKYHISKLEGIIRLVNNDVLETEPVDALQEDLDYYLDSYQDEEYVQAYDQDFFYESLGLDDLDVVNVDRVTQPPLPTKKSVDDATETSSKGSKDIRNGKKASTSSVIPLTIGRARSKAEKKADEEIERALIASTPAKKPAASPQPAPVVAPVVAAAPPVPAGASMAAMLKRETEQQEKERQKVGSRMRLSCTVSLRVNQTHALSLFHFYSNNSNSKCSKNSCGNSSSSSKNSFASRKHSALNSNKPRKRHCSDNNKRRSASSKLSNKLNRKRRQSSSKLLLSFRRRPSSERWRNKKLRRCKTSCNSRLKVGRPMLSIFLHRVLGASVSAARWMAAVPTHRTCHSARRGRLPVGMRITPVGAHWNWLDRLI
jgi:CCR4-NOT transcriptional regulation complex NOT5 subunit